MLQIELYVAGVDEASQLFISVFDLRLIENKPGFCQLRHKDNYDIMLFTPGASDGQSHWPLPQNGEGGIGIEIVLTVADAAAKHAAVTELGYKPTAIERAPWGSLEFIFRMKEGYLIRVKQPA